MCEISSSFPYSLERWHQSKSYLPPGQSKSTSYSLLWSWAFMATPFLVFHLATDTAVLLFSKLASLKSATCTREPETYHRVHKPFKSTSFTKRTTISVGYGVKFILLSRNHKKDCTNPNHTWHLSTAQWAGAPPTPYGEADLKQRSLKHALLQSLFSPLAPPKIATWTREEDLFIISVHYHKS